MKSFGSVPFNIGADDAGDMAANYADDAVEAMNALKSSDLEYQHGKDHIKHLLMLAQVYATLATTAVVVETGENDELEVRVKP